MSMLLHASKAFADANVARITAAMGLHPNGNVTARWDVPRLDANGKWVVTKPEGRHMGDVDRYTEGEPVWPADPGMGG